MISKILHDHSMKSRLQFITQWLQMLTISTALDNVQFRVLFQHIIFPLHYSQNSACVFSLGTDDGHRVLRSISDVMDCEHDYINATYIDVRPLENTYLTDENQHHLYLFICYFD